MAKKYTEIKKELEEFQIEMETSRKVVLAITNRWYGR